MKNHYSVFLIAAIFCLTGKVYGGELEDLKERVDQLASTVEKLSLQFPAPLDGVIPKGTQVYEISENCDEIQPDPDDDSFRYGSYEFQLLKEILCDKGIFLLVRYRFNGRYSQYYPAMVLKKDVVLTP